MRLKHKMLLKATNWDPVTAWRSFVAAPPFPLAVLAFVFIARRVQPSLSLVDREADVFTYELRYVDRVKRVCCTLYAYKHGKNEKIHFVWWRNPPHP